MFPYWPKQLFPKKSRPAPRRRSTSVRLGIEALEAREVPTVSVGVINGVLTAQADSGFNTVTVDHTVVGGKGFAVIDGRDFADTKYTSIRINGGAGGTLTDIRANVKPVTVFGDSAHDTVNLGDASNKVQGIKATVLAEDAQGSGATVNINDEGDTATRTVTINTVPRAGDPLGQVTGLGAAVIQWDYHGTQAVALNLGIGASHVNVLGTGVSTNIFNSAPAAINVGNNGSTAGIRGAVNLLNDFSTDLVNINDKGDATPRAVSLSTIPQAGDASLGAVNGLGAQITWDNSHTSAVNLNLGAGSSIVDVLATGVTTNVFNNGNATIFVGNNGSTAGIQGNLNLENNIGHDAVNINSQNDFAGPRTVTLSTITQGGASFGTIKGLPGPGQITYDYKHTSAANLNLGREATEVDVQGTGVPTSIFNNGNSDIFVGTGSITGIQGNLNLDSVLKDTIFIDDAKDTVGRTFTFNTPKAGFGFTSTASNGIVNWDVQQVTGVTLFGGSGGDTYNFFTILNPTTVFGGAGANTFNVGTGQGLGGDIQAILSLSGGGNAHTVLNIDDRLNLNSEMYNFSISKPGSDILQLLSTPGFDLNFGSMLGGVNLTINQQNDSAFLNDPSGTVNLLFF
jgi:hypothetical protein